MQGTIAAVQRWAQPLETRPLPLEQKMHYSKRLTSHALAQLPHLGRQVDVHLRANKHERSSEGEGQGCKGPAGRRKPAGLRVCTTHTAALLLPGRRPQSSMRRVQATRAAVQSPREGSSSNKQQGPHLDEQCVGVLGRHLVQLGEQAAAGAARRLQVVDNLRERARGHGFERSQG